MLIEEALTQYPCEYDSWDDVSPLWLLTYMTYLKEGPIEEILELADLMLKRGDSIDNIAYFTVLDDLTYTPLCMAAKHGSAEMVSLLLENGADPGAGDEKPLIAAVKKYEEEVVKILLESGVDVNQTDEFSNTALYWARDNNDYQMIKLLKQYGAN